MKVLILSDLHMGHPSSRVEASLDGLARLCARYDRVIVNGDGMDRWEQPDPTPASRGWLARLRAALTSRGGPPELVTGNHDPAVSETHYVYLTEPKLLAYHGDYMRDCSSPWLDFSPEFRRRLFAALESHGPARLFGARPAIFRRLQCELYLERPEIFEHRQFRPFRYLLFHATHPWRIASVAHYLLRMPVWVAGAAGQFDRPVEHVAVGHSHRPGRWRRAGVRVYNTGSFMPLSRPYAVEVEGAAVRHVPLAALLDGLPRAVARDATASPRARLEAGSKQI
ncbi:MAG: metallophosphoesterase family protein [Planctomycetota bacterium]|nr:metallophosphoesterase family protein [Planctomycetota bacterium]